MKKRHPTFLFSIIKNRILAIDNRFTVCHYNANRRPFQMIALAIFVLVIIDPVFSQNKAVDSLMNIVKQNKANSATYNQLALEHWYIDMKKSKGFAEQAFNLATKESDSLQIAHAYNRLGAANFYLDNIDSAQIYYKKSANILKKIGKQNDLAGAIGCCAKVHEQKYEYDSAINLYTQSLELFSKSGMSEYNAQVYISVGIMYIKKGDFKSAMEYLEKAYENESYLNDRDKVMIYNNMATCIQNLGDFRRAIKFFEMSINKCYSTHNNVVLANTYIRIADLYNVWEKNETALEYYEKALELSKTIQISQYYRRVLCLIADIYFKQDKSEKAKVYYSEAIDSSVLANDVQCKAWSYNGLSKIYTKEKQYDEAIKYALKTLNLFEDIKDQMQITTSHYLLAQNYLLLSDPEKAKKHIDIATSIAQDAGYKDVEIKLLSLWANYYTEINDVKGSSKYYEKYIEMKDSIFAKKNQELLTRYQVELNNQEKDYQLKEAEQLNKQRAMELSQKKRQIIYISTLSLLLLLGIIVFAIMNFRQQKANRVLFLKNKELLEPGNKPLKPTEGIEIAESLQIEIIQKLNKEIDENKVYLRNDLSLHSLAKILDTNSTYLSQIINTNYNCSFSTYLNNLRITEAQKMILDKQFENYTIDAISRECGYNSKSTFNKAFKDITGLTPGEYKQQEETIDALEYNKSPLSWKTV